MRKLNNDWIFTEQWTEGFLEGREEGATVRIPHTVKEMPLHYSDPDDYQMVSGYRKTFTLTEEEKGKRLFLTFEGAAHIADLYINGEHVLQHRNGYTAFTAEITDLVKDGENVICVKLDSTENPEIPPFGFVIDYLTYGGIYRDVKLEARGSVLVEDAYITTPTLSLAQAEVKINGNVSDEVLKVILRDPDGKVVVENEYPAEDDTLLFEVEDARSWNPDHPNLYTCELQIVKNNEVIDTLVKTFGFRTISLNENQFLLNGSPVFIRGLNRHQCYPYVGYAVPDALQVEDARILKEELGVNAVRTSHYPQSHAFLDACDRMGLLVFTEIPGWQHLGDEAWKEQCVENVREMVLQYRQHPSIFLWGVRVNESLDCDELYERTNALCRKLDPTRPTSGVRYLEKSSLLEDVYSYNDFSHNGITPGAKAKKDVTPDVKKPLLISEANGHMYPTKSYDNWEKRQEHALRHARVLDAAMGDGGHMGCYQWCMFDYATHKDFGSGDRICYHGVMDAFRNPKLAAYVYASQSENTDVLKIGSSMDIGDYPAGNIGDIYAFTNADEVKLYKNDQYVASFTPKGWKGLKHGPVLIDDTVGHLLEENEGFDEKKAKLIRGCLNAAGKYGPAAMPAKYKAELAYAMVKYKMKYEDGVELFGKYVGNWGGSSTEWKFEGWKNGQKVSEVIKSPRTKLHLDVKASHTELHEGDTYDMAALRISCLDELNNEAVYAQLPVSVTAIGPIEIVGPDTAVLEGGMSGTYIRTTGEAGKAEVLLSAPGLDTVKVEFTVVKE